MRSILLNLAHHGFATYEWPRLGPPLRRAPNDIGVEQLTIGIHVPVVPGVEASSHALDILLRHGPRSIPLSAACRERHGFHEYRPISIGLALPPLTIGIARR